MSGLFSSPKIPEPVIPEIPEVTVLPDTDAIAAAAKKRSLKEQQQRGGRASTILSTSDKLGS